MGKHKKKRDSTTSSGRRKARRLNSQVRRLQMKIAKWERYIQEIEQNKRKGSANRWNTAGLKKHMELLERLI